MPVVMPIDSYSENGKGKYVKAKLAAINNVNCMNSGLNFKSKIDCFFNVTRCKKDVTTTPKPIAIIAPFSCKYGCDARTSIINNLATPP